ncbi:hypothetical protein Dsin_021575 [Dipteronia sinensis]|uniref:MULE transposase domain-containing protein n=1 Tax=Dipteronia sinensis TaxID=43782 RepID=A0AAE0DYY0_9ROSI|nr:hypothetical protein Dsin_021575 [Dipteronia sinensis]
MVSLEPGAIDIFKIFVQARVNLVEVGECDADHISLITLIHAICQKLSGSSDVPLFEERGLNMIVFELKDYCYVPTPPEEPLVLDMQGGYKPLDWCDMEDEQLNYEGDSKQDDDKDDEANEDYSCGWKAHGSFTIDGVTFMLKTLPDQHDCHRVYNNKEAKVKWIASKFKKLVKSNPSIDVNVIGDLLRESYKVSIDIQTLYRAKRKALKELANDHAKCFGYLKRPFIGVDECHTKGLFGGVLLSAVSLDANNALFPLAVCIYKKETQDSWEWFLNNLSIYLNYPEGRNLTSMFDRQKGAIVALEVHFPFTYRR